jgi:hypothetical protein
MARGHWSFLHEWVIYDYLLARVDEGTLRLKQVIAQGKLLGRAKWIKIDKILPIKGTSFPDIQSIRFIGNTSSFRPAEVKFTTSLFNYHQELKYAIKFGQFVEQSGFILVVSHDYLPKGLVEKYAKVDVCEIDLDDFITFCRENFSRLLNRQIKAHSSTRVWLMYQAENFNQGTDKIRPARQSYIWCPTENLTGFDLAPGDRILFYKTSGLDTIKLQNKYLKEGVVDSRWILREICVAEVKSKIFSRHEYLEYKSQAADQPLWKNDPVKNGMRRWNRVFEFRIVKLINVNRGMDELFSIPGSKTFSIKALEAFCYKKSREMSLASYRDLLEVLC